MNDYYVYVYIDPRNLEEFYYGKGRGSRKDAHLKDGSDSEKTARIKAIREAGEAPIVRVIARGLSEHDALLVEKTLLWKLGRTLTNVATGHYAENFRPHDTIHRRLAHFDYQNGVYYYNVGEGPNRCWEDFHDFGFISAGQGVSFRDAILGFEPGDIVAAKITRIGYVGVGRILKNARPVREVTIKGRPVLSLPLACKGMAMHAEDDARCEYVCPVEWLAKTTREGAKWQKNAGLYAPRKHIRASLENQPLTLAFLEEQFGVDLEASADA